MVNVLVVDDSRTARDYLVHLLNADPDIHVVGTAGDGLDALATVQRLHPDVITIDIAMQTLDGIEATRRIMQTVPTPIVIVSGLIAKEDTVMAFRALDAGALAALPRPPGPGHPDHQASVRKLVSTVKLMSEIKVVRRWERATAAERRPRPALPADPPPALAPRGPIKLIAVGASTGGPPVLRDLLGALPAHFPVPLVLVQHIADGFIEGFAEWLAGFSPNRVVVPGDGDLLRKGHVYVAPAHVHLGVGYGNRAQLRQAPLEYGVRPAVSYLFRSVAESVGAAAVGVLLTGMGSDGAAELKELRERGAITIAQDYASSVVHGMPGEAIRLGGAMYIRPADQIAGLLIELVQASAA